MSVVTLPPKPVERVPMPGPAFIELGAMSNFTFLEGASHPKDLVLAAKVLGHGSIGIADRNSFAGLVRGMAAVEDVNKKYGEDGFRFIPGCRVALVDGQEYLVWPTDLAAYGRLSQMLSDARMHTEKGDCRVTRDMLLAAAEGQVMAIIPPDGMPDATFARRLHEDAAALRPSLAMPLFCAAWHRFGGDDRKRLDALAALGSPLLAAGGVRFHAPDRKRLADVVAAIRLGVTIDNLGFAAHQNAEAHLKPAREMLRLFAGHEDAIAATIRVAAACDCDLRKLDYRYPTEILDEGLTAQETLERRVAEAARERWPDAVPEKVARNIASELEIIGKLDYAPYFLTVHEIVKFARSRGILCQGRGSAANSTICNVLRITSLKPDKHDLLFARFISLARHEPPDIDVDFEHERREEVIQHIYEKYGRDRAALCATLICYRGRSAIREVGKAMGLSEDVTGRLAKGTWHYDDGDRRQLAREQGMQPDADPRLSMALDLASELEGFPRHLATHVGGFVIARGKLTELAVVTKAAMQDRHTVEWDKDDIDVLRMMKVDVLGLGMLSCIRRGFDFLEPILGRRLDLDDFDQNDAATYRMLSRGDSLGVFQVESRAQMNMLPRLRPTKFYDLVVEVAIVRPGPIEGDMVHPYLQRRDLIRAGRGHEITYPSEALRGVLEKTLGVPLFQEQAMQIAIVGAGFNDARADQLRRAMAAFKSDGDLSRFEDEFLTGMRRNGYADDFSRRCFEQMRGFRGYGFPESHAASFASLVYVSAWIKCHHPAVFTAALLNSQPMGFYAPAQLVRDAQEHGVPVRPVDVLESDWDCTLEPIAGTKDHALRLGLRLVEGLAATMGAAIVATRPFATLPELIARAGLDRRAVGALAAADAFRGLKLDRRHALWEAAAVERAAPPPLPLFAAAEAAPVLPIPTDGENTVLDYGATGLTLRHHPMTLLRPLLVKERCADTRDFQRARQGQKLRIPGLVLVRQRPGSANGVVFFTIEDEFGVANLVLYQSVIEQFRATVIGARLLIAEGRVERHDKGEVPILHLIVRGLEDRSALLDELHLMENRLRPRLSRADEVERPQHHRRKPAALNTSRDWR